MEKFIHSVKRIKLLNKLLIVLFVLLYSSFLYAQVPSISYSGVQSNYSINNPISPLTPTNVGGLPISRTNVTTAAGSGASGYMDGSTVSPKYYYPTGVAVAASGNIYIADNQNHCIRKISSSGYVSTLAGTGISGFANGAGNTAQFNSPYAIAVDASENVYVTESSTHCIRKITSTGVVSTLAGNPITAGFLDAQGLAALFSGPRGIAVDNSGNVYVADSNNNRIRKISITGLVSTLAGDGTAGYLDGQGLSAKFNNPSGVAVSGSGTVYIGDTSNNRIRAIAISGLVTTLAGSGNPGSINGQGTFAEFNSPRSLSIDTSNTIYVVDYTNNRIRSISNTGLVSTLAGTGAYSFINGVGSSATFKYPEGIATDSSGNIYVADVYNNSIRKITNSGDTSTFSGSSVRGLVNGQGGVMAMFNSPVAVTASSTGEVYVTDDFNSCIRVISTMGIVSTLAGDAVVTGFSDGQGSSAKFNYPKGIAVDASGNVYVADTNNNRIRKITSSGIVTTIAGDGTAGFLDGQGTAAKFNNPYALTLDNLGNIYVADTKNHRIRKISPTGLVTTIAGYFLSGFLDGAAASARFKNPQGIAFDNTTGMLYVCDTGNHKIRKISTDGMVSTFAGSFAGYLDEQGTAAQFNTPIGITIDSSSNLYIGDYYNSVIRKITSSGLVSTFTGIGISQFLDGLGNVASFYFPIGVSIDAYGSIYVADSYNQRIRKVSSLTPYTITPALPLGVNFDSATGILSGTPTEIKTATTYTIGASNYSGTATTTINFATVGSTTTSPPTASAQSFCNSATVANLVATGTSLQWYNVASGGTALASTTALTTGNYYVSQTVNSIESARTTVAVSINTTTAPTASAQSFCNAASVANLVATGTSLRWYNVATGGTALASTTALTTGTYYVSQTLNSCESVRTAITVTINTTATPTASAQSFCNAATVANLVATGTSLQWYNVATGGTALASITALTTGTYYVSQTLNSCESARATVGVTINTTLAPTASAQSFCNAATVANLVATGTSLRWYNVATGGTALASTTALTTGTYYVSQTLNSCESARSTVVVTINTTAAPTASAQSFCNAASVANLVATGTSLQWYNVATGGTALASTTALTSGTYYVSQTLNSCESARVTVSVTINTTAAPTATTQSFCNAATVANLVATGTSLRWYNVATGGTALASTTALTTGTYYVSQTLNSCESARATVAVTINTTAVPTATAQSFCNAATVANLVATGTSLQWYNVATGGTALASTTALTTGTYYVSQTLNSCESIRATVAVTINTTAAPTASAQTFNNSATVANLVASGTSLQWYNVATGGTALALTTALTTGTYYVSQTLNSCESVRTSVAVTINIAPGSPTASAQSFCNAATVANLVATGTSLQWYNVASGGTALASTTALTTGNYYVSQTVNSIESARTTVAVTINTTAAPTASAQSFCNAATVANLVATGTSLRWYNVATGGTALASTTALTTGAYYVSQTLNSCESARVTVSVTINTTAAPTASAQSFCNAASVANLVATGTSLQWYNVAGGGTALASTTALTTGTYYVSQTLNSCESARATVAVTINTTAEPIASAQSFCNSAMVANLVATGISLRWYNVATGGTALASTTALTTGTYYVSQTLNSCESARATVAVTINTTVAPIASAQTFNNSATVANLVASGSSLQWYNVAGGGTALASTTALTTGTYYVSQTLNSCESPRIEVAVTINIIPTAPIAVAQSFCNSATVSDLVATGTSLQWYNVASGGTALASTTVLTTGNYYVSQTVNSIESARTTVAVTINTTAAPTATTQTFCNVVSVANLVASGTSLRWYNVPVGGSPLASTTSLGTGYYYVSQTLNFCESARTMVAVTVANATGLKVLNQTVCSGTGTSISVAAGYTGTLKWMKSTDFGSKGASARWSNVSGTSTTISTGNLTVATWFRATLTVAGNCTATTTPIGISVIAKPVAKSITSPTSSGTSSAPICTSVSKVLNVSSGYVATAIQWEIAVVPLTSSTVPASSAYTPIVGATGASYTVANAIGGKNYFRVKFTNGSCTAVYSSAFIVYYKDCTVVSKDDVTEDKLISVVSYPNPFSNNFNLDVKTLSEAKIRVAIYDITGRLIEQKEADSTNLDVMQLGSLCTASGIYNVIITQDSEIKTLRVIKR